MVLSRVIQSGDGRFTTWEGLQKPSPAGMLAWSLQGRIYSVFLQALPRGKPNSLAESFAQGNEMFNSAGKNPPPFYRFAISTVNFEHLFYWFR